MEASLYRLDVSVEPFDFSPRVVESDGELFLRVQAPVMPLPSDKELIVPLMHELLELNLKIKSAARVGIGDEMVFVAVIRSVMELRSDDVVRSIHSVMTIADGIDHVLIEKYGGTSKKRIPADSTPLMEYFGYAASMRVRQSSLDAVKEEIESWGIEYTFPSGSNSAHDYITLSKAARELSASVELSWLKNEVAEVFGDAENAVDTAGRQ